MNRQDEVLWATLRIVLALLIAAHGWARLFADAVVPFGQWLDGRGLPAGPVIAWAVTGYEIAGSALFAVGRFVFPLSLGFAAIYLAGLVLVHLPEGWFVVGLGRNGMEYGVLLVVALLCVGLHHRHAAPPA
ncbi:MAG: DoxX family protein [Lysobacteraceae bacterium]|jgi:Predicted membrane protein|nr:DoxX family protein [Xanthomonadaceae bacterium]